MTPCCSSEYITDSKVWSNLWCFHFEGKQVQEEKILHVVFQKREKTHLHISWKVHVLLLRHGFDIAFRCYPFSLSPFQVCYCLFPHKVPTPTSKNVIHTITSRETCLFCLILDIIDTTYNRYASLIPSLLIAVILTLAGQEESYSNLRLDPKWTFFVCSTVIATSFFLLSMKQDFNGMLATNPSG